MTQKENREAKRARMFGLIENYMSKDCKQKDFCKDHNIAYQTFLFWLKQYRHEKQDSEYGKKQKTGTDGFIPISVPESGYSFSEYPLEILYPNGIRLFLDSRTNIQLLKQLIDLQAVLSCFCLRVV